MNGQEMLEALGEIDLKYIDDAAQAPKRKKRHRRAALTSAACAAVVLLAAWQWVGQQSKGVESIGLEMDDIAMPENAFAEPAVASYSMDTSAVARSAGTGETGAATVTAGIIPCEMTVRVVQQQEDGTVVCTVVNSGTGDFQPEQELVITWAQDNTPEAAGTYVITYQYEEADAICALSVLPVD